MSDNGAPPLRCACITGGRICRAHRTPRLGISEHIAAAGHTITLEQYRRLTST